MSGFDIRWLLAASRTSVIVLVMRMRGLVLVHLRHMHLPGTLACCVLPQAYPSLLCREFESEEQLVRRLRVTTLIKIGNRREMRLLLQYVVDDEMMRNRRAAFRRHLHSLILPRHGCEQSNRKESRQLKTISLLEIT